MDMLSRFSFCEKISKCLINLLNQKYGVDEAFDKCLVQRTRHPALKKMGDLHINRTLVRYLEMKYSRVASIDQPFTLCLHDVLDLLIEESHAWRISLIYWNEHNGGFLLGVNRLQTFSYILPNVMDSELDAQLKTVSERFLTLCHVSDNPSLHDLRTLIYCDVLSNYLKSEILLSNNGDYCESSYEELAKELNLKIHFMTPIKTGVDSPNAPTHFMDCMQDDEKLYPYLQKLHYNSMRTAFASKVMNNKQNIIMHKSREAMSRILNSEVRCTHLCNHTNAVTAQQTELYHAWCEDEKHRDRIKEYVGHCDTYLTHSGARSTPISTVADLLHERREQIKTSFESKLQKNADGGSWDIIFHKMRAALVKLEFLKTSATNQIKLENTLPSDAVFILYNYSRLCVLMEAYSEKVAQGCYSDASLHDIDFKCLQEEAEWELLIDHLWTLPDALQTVIPAFAEHHLKLNCHHLIEYLHQLCRSVSTYYSRYHILVEGLPHLIPTISARITLMKVIKRAMEKAFHSIGIEPVSQM